MHFKDGRPNWSKFSAYVTGAAMGTGNALVWTAHSLAQVILGVLVVLVGIINFLATKDL